MLRSLARLLVFVCCTSAAAVAQDEQTVRGVVLDRDTRIPLIGANILVVDADPLLGAATDADGRFVLHRVPLGRQTLQVRYIGYAPQLLP
ncbi:MAG: carboxypeptidase-like regulatory domain-containing protein, partial [Rhodothermaceae bacterium]|nr:carboxypeptidase-like regulatory domain-containing protein [Rhodothermaceae bacterium]